MEAQAGPDADLWQYPVRPGDTIGVVHIARETSSFARPQLVIIYLVFNKTVASSAPDHTERFEMADTMDSGVKMYDIRSDKSEASLLDMLKQGLSSEPKTIPTLLLYDGDLPSLSAVSPY